MIEISAMDAWENVNRRNNFSHWKSVLERMQKSCVLAQFSQEKKLTSADKVFCIGSCFAKNIEKQLVVAGMQVLSHPNFFPKDGESIAPLPNIYNIWSLYNEIEWGIGNASAIPQSCIYTDDRGKAYDGSGGIDRFRRDESELIATRAGVTANVRRLVDCTVLVLTLGLAEVWFDLETGLYLNSTLPKIVMARYPNRFVLRVLDYSDIRAALEKIYGLLTKYAHPELHVFISVSPVPLSASFGTDDVLVANNYSKSSQVAAAIDFSRQHANVTYVPSFESVVTSTRRFAWEEDGRHVTDHMVHQIIQRFLIAQGVQAGEEIENEEITTSDWPVIPAQASVLDGVPRFQSAEAGDENFPAGFPHVTASSIMAEDYTATYMMSPAKGCWHAQRPPQYPEGLLFEFEKPFTPKTIYLRAQEGTPERAPTAFELLRLDGEHWVTVLNVCNIRWRDEAFWKSWVIEQIDSSVAFLLRINDGPADILTLRNVYLSPK